MNTSTYLPGNFPSFSEGLSLRPVVFHDAARGDKLFPFLFGGTFIEALALHHFIAPDFTNFPSFSEGLSLRQRDVGNFLRGLWYFPSFSEGLSLRLRLVIALSINLPISLPFRRDFH